MNNGAKLVIKTDLANFFATNWTKWTTDLSFKDENTALAKIVRRGAWPKRNVAWFGVDRCSRPNRLNRFDRLLWEADATWGIAFLGVCRRHYMAEECSYRFVGLVRIWTKTGRFSGPKANMKHLKHPKHPKHLKHLKHFLWMFGLLFCQHFKELCGKVNDGVHRGQDQKGMLLVLGWKAWRCGWE